MSDQGCVMRKWKRGSEMQGETQMMGMRKGKQSESRWKFKKQGRNQTVL